MNRPWTTRLDPSFTNQYGVVELHSAWWVPPQWPGSGAVVGLSIPECELQVVFPDRGDGEPVVVINRPRNRRVKAWLRCACEQAVKYRACLHISADTAEQIELAARRVARLLPRYERAALERMYDSATRVKEKLS